MTETLDAKTYYEREAVEKIRGEPDDPWRFRYTAKALPPAFDSLLDVGCGEGRWLSYLQRRRPGPRLTGIELSATRVEEIQRSAPGFRVEVGGLPDLPYDDDAFDVVTCLEVVEHIPDWKTAVTELLRVARRRVIITVPYRERIRQHLCIHCHKPTPAHGHLHSFSEDSFAYLAADHRLSFGRIPRRGGRWVVRVYLAMFPQYSWLTVKVDVS